MVFSAKIRGIPPANRSLLGGARARAGFSLVEVVTSLGVLTLIAGSSIWALNQMNTSAAANRISTCAEILAQNEVDAFLSAEPYAPGLGQVPAALAIVTNSTSPMILPINADGSITLYTDPSGASTVRSNRPTDTPPGFVRTVADLGLNQTTNGVTTNLNARRLSVMINYAFKGKPYSVALNSLRVSDL